MEETPKRGRGWPKGKPRGPARPLTPLERAERWSAALYTRARLALAEKGIIDIEQLREYETWQQLADTPQEAKRKRRRMTASLARFCVAAASSDDPDVWRRLFDWPTEPPPPLMPLREVEKRVLHLRFRARVQGRPLTMSEIAAKLKYKNERDVQGLVHFAAAKLVARARYIEQGHDVPDYIQKDLSEWADVIEQATHTYCVACGRNAWTHRHEAIQRGRMYG